MGAASGVLCKLHSSKVLQICTGVAYHRLANNQRGKERRVVVAAKNCIKEGNLCGQEGILCLASAP